MVHMETFRLNTSVCFGTGSLKALKDLPGQRIFLVTDPFLVKSGITKQVTEQLSDKQIEIYDKVQPDPSLHLVTEGVLAMTSFMPDAVVALGGGSAMDEAKAILFFAQKAGKLPRIPLTAIPTTSGTGSEVTSFSVITDPLKNIKYPLMDPSLLPSMAILDPELTKTVPPSVKADTGMDVLTHALEAYVSTRSNPFTDALAEKAICLVFRFLPRSFHDSSDQEALEQMQLASCMAGLAFDKASLGLNHAIAHSIGGRFKIPHGRTNAVLLPLVMEFNAGFSGYGQSEVSPAAKKYAQAASLLDMGGGTIRTSVKNLIREVRKLSRSLSIPETFQDCGLSLEPFKRQAGELAGAALSDRCIITNPRPAKEADIRNILDQAFGR